MPMDRRFAWVMAGALALAACQKGEHKTAVPTPTPTASTVASAAPAVAAKPACAPVPNLALAPDFADTRGQFGKDSKAFKELVANFAAAYAKACAGGLFAKEPLVPAGAPHPDTLFVHNAPDANDVAIYLEPNEGDRRSDMLLEYYFITADGTAHVPSAADLKEAIYCDTVGASEAEADTSGRCLVD
jgi:hypothetical protein